MRLLSSTVILFAAGCSSSASFDGAAPGSPGGGGVSFGGAQDVGEFRGILDRGEIPGPDTLDANGFFNEHFNAPPPASCGALLCAVPGLSVGRDWLTGAHQATLQISVSTTVDPSTYQRLPMNLVVVVDHSGSMASDGRLDKVKAGLHTMIDNLHDEDRLAIVQFDDRVDVLAPLGTALDRTAMHAVVNGLQPRGATDIFDGLSTGFQLLGDAPPGERQNRVIFLSDGNATAGDTVQADILAMAASRVKLGIGLTTIGVGNDFDVELMRGLAEQGAGNFYFLEDPSAATEVFTEELDFFMQPLALDIQLSAAAGPGYQLGEVVGSHLWSAGSRNGSMQIPAVFVASRTSQSGEQGRRGGGSMIFIHLTPIAGNTGRVADVTLSYRTPGSADRILADRGARLRGRSRGHPRAALPVRARDVRALRDVQHVPRPARRDQVARPGLRDGGARRDPRRRHRRGTARTRTPTSRPTSCCSTSTAPTSGAWPRPAASARSASARPPASRTRRSTACRSASPATATPGAYACSAGGASGGLPIALVALAACLRRRRRR